MDDSSNPLAHASHRQAVALAIATSIMTGRAGDLTEQEKSTLEAYLYRGAELPTAFHALVDDHQPTSILTRIQAASALDLCDQSGSMTPAKSQLGAELQELFTEGTPVVFEEIVPASSAHSAGLLYTTPPARAAGDEQPEQSL